MKKLLSKSDWIVLRLIMQFEYVEKGLDGDAFHATQFLIDKYGPNVVEKAMNLIKKDEEYQKFCFFKLAEDYLISQGKIV